MLFLRGLRPGVSCLRRGLKANKTFVQLAFNLKGHAIVSADEHYSSYARSEISLADDNVKKYIKRIVDQYEKHNVVHTEISSEQGYSEVHKLLGNRTSIVESIKSLEELEVDLEPKNYRKNNVDLKKYSEINLDIKNYADINLNSLKKLPDPIYNFNHFPGTNSVQQDPEMKKLGKEEFDMYKEELAKLDEELLEAVVQKCGRDDCREILLELTTGVGGQEAMLFARDLYEMYLGYLDYLGFDHEVLQQDAGSASGGIRHACIAITGNRALEMFRHEGGVHRVQRIPATEKSGRVHTSTVSVAVLPQPTDIEIDLKDKDLKIETKNASGAGGQHVNTTDSAVRITHLPTGLSVECQTDRSQIKNRKIAMITLRTRIYEKQLNEQRTISGELRKKQFGLGQRNEKIRTYNFNQDRITDHRLVDGTMHNLKGFLEGGQVLRELQAKLQRQLQINLLLESINRVVK